MCRIHWCGKRCKVCGDNVALQHWLQLALADGLGPILIDRLIAAAGDAAKAAAASREMLKVVEGIGGKSASKIHQALQESVAAAENEIARCRELGVQLICRDDPLYPPSLQIIPSSPPVLWVKGTLEARDLNALAIVGSRRCSLYGREQADRFAALLAGAGFTVISGGARGVDSAAHRGAMQHPHGRTLAVLGCGVDVVYPPENAALFAQIAQRGAIISEFPLESPPIAEHFPRRNRIVSGLSRGVLVVEADTTSGALITARLAADEHNRPVFAIPGRVDNPLSAGPHKLLRDGAVLTEGLADILNELGPLPQIAMDVAVPVVPTIPEKTEKQPALFTAPASLSAHQQQIMDVLDTQPVTVDALVESTGLPPEVLLRELTMLTLHGQAKRVDGQMFCKRVKK